MNMVVVWLGVVLCLALLPRAAWAEWKVPDPDKAGHPGATEAPAGDPRTYPDKEGFERRAQTILKGLATNDLSVWRRGWFTGGDPGKYLPGAAMAMLLLKSDDQTARQYMNDGRSPTEHYHFAAVNWARFLPLFGEALTSETRQKFAQQAARYGSYLSPGGTENHKTMWMTTANVLPHYVEGERFGQAGKADALRRARNMLKEYVKGLYTAGQGEWDSSTYLMFDVNGMLNIYDFSRDPECRLLAKAALDWYIAAYALKYADGVYCAPNQRGFAPAAAKKIADQTGWLWWGSHLELKPEETRGFLYTVQPITSAWRPNKVLCNIAQRNVAKLPFEQRNSKPNYWYGLRLAPTPNQYQETIYVTRHYTMGSLWHGWGGQLSRFQLVAASPRGGLSFTGGHPTDAKFEDGGGKHDQSAQVGGTYISLSVLPDDEALPYSFFSWPESVGMPVRQGAWWVMTAGSAYIGLYPLSAQVAPAERELSARQKEENAKAAQEGKAPKHKPATILRMDGRVTGFVLETADAETFPNVAEFAKALNARVKVDASQLAAAHRVSCVNLAGRTIQLKHGGDKPPESILDGAQADFASWPIYGGPYVHQKNCVLTVNDGREGFVIDFSGELPVYRPWKPE